MNIVVIGGSPKGEKSVTMQYVQYLKNNADDTNFIEHFAAKNIRNYENDEVVFNEFLLDVKKADAVLWAFPLYFALVHGSYKRFIELLFERKSMDIFTGKHCALLATSIHFFDHTAIEYMRGISEDLGMIVDEVHSAHMSDLMQKEGEAQLTKFWDIWRLKIKEDVQAGRLSLPVKYASRKLELSKTRVITKRKGLKVGIVTESGISENLDAMVACLDEEFAETEIFDLSTMKILGGCLGCLKCGYENHCAYEGKDEVIDTYRKLKDCDALVFAGAIRDRYLTSRWKTFIDRLFFSTHIPYFNQKVIAFLISGPLQQLPNLRELLTGFFEADGLTIAGIVTDEEDGIEKKIEGLAISLERYCKDGYHPPRMFIGEGGHLIFRDSIFGGLRGVFVADHKYYKKNKLYDFPQKDWGTRLSGSMLHLMMKIPFIRREIQSNMPDYMIRSYAKTINKKR